jgi:diadenosine tetraphosphate (Ap4A) HIT family hydrolase
MLLDKFPKARRHGLVLPRDPSLDSIYDLQREHLPLLRYMVVRVLLFVSHEFGFCVKLHLGPAEGAPPRAALHGGACAALCLT